MNPQARTTPLIDEIRPLLHRHDWRALRARVSREPALRLVELLYDLAPRERILVYRLLPRSKALEVFEALDVEQQNALIAHMAQDEARAALAQLSPDDRTALLEEMPSPVARKLMDLLPDPQRRDALMLLNYPPNSVGRLMTTNYVRVRPHWTCAQVIDHIRQYGSDSETLWMVYVVNEHRQLLDDVRVRQILISDPALSISSLMDNRFVALHTHQEREHAVALFRKYDLYAIPVVDADNVLLGIVTADDILAVDEQEATEDFHKLGTVRPLEVRFSEASVRLLVRSRLGWLLGLVAVNVFSGAGIAYFEHVIARMVPLVFFMPLLVDSGGNAGSQSVALTVRAMATGDVRLRDWPRLLLRETFLSILLGLSMAVVVFGLGWYRQGWLLGLTVALAMLAVVVLGSLVGQLLPFVLRAMGMDAATAGSPLVTSIVDICGCVVYLAIAKAIMGL
ncbi:MAG: magnesium transporter [bacterium]|nr:magnesium transporter [bacterium]